MNTTQYEITQGHLRGVMKNIIYEEDGYNWVNIADLKENPLNTLLYGDESAEEAKQLELAASMRKEMDRGFPPNKVPISIHPDGTISSGHTRWKSGKQIGATRLKAEYTTDDFPNGNDPTFDDLSNIADTNIYREMSYSVKLNCYLTLKEAWENQHDKKMTGKPKEKLLKQISIHEQTVKRLSEIKDFRPDLLKDIDKGSTSIEYAWKVATGRELKVIPAKKNGMNLYKLFTPEMKVRLISYAVNALKQYRNVNVETKDGLLSPIEDDLGWEPVRFTGIVSDTFMWAMGVVLREEGYQVQTANGSPMDADVFLVNENEKIEIKCTEFKGSGSGTSWKGGNGIREGEFLLVAHADNFTKLFITFTSLTRDDWKRMGNVGTELTLKTWCENHAEDPETNEFWTGNVYFSSSANTTIMALESI